MDVFNKIFAGVKSTEIDTQDKSFIKGMGYIEEAQTAAKIINTGVEKKDFSQIEEELKQLPTTGISREKYVFEQDNSLFEVRVIFICVMFAIGYLYFVPISLGMMMYSNDYEKYAWCGLLGTIAVLATNVVVIKWAISRMRFNKRYDSYLNVLRFRNIELIDDLASYSNQDPDLVIKDLKKAVDLKLIPQGHFGRDNLIFIVSDEINNIYKEKQAVYDRYYRKQSEERLRMKERTKEIQNILDQGQFYVNKIHESNDIIKDKIISEKLDRMEKVVSMIFHEVDISPAQADKLGMFMNYYLPTTEKLLGAYIEIDEKEIKGKTLQKTKKEIEGTIDKIIDSFEGLLDRFYREQEMDISTDISAMEILMKQEGLNESESE